MKQVPNLFTLLNLVFGCIGIALILQYNPGGGGLNLSGMSLIMGSLCLFLSAIIDFLDGFIARLFKATSAMGEQLDSLADVVSFGVAPGMILYKLLEVSLYRNPVPEGTNLWYYLPALIFPCAAAWRLAKFNLDKEQTYYFKGMPTPAAGLTIASLPLIRLGTFDIQNLLGNPFILYSIIILLSWLMVSDMRLVSLKFKNYTFNGNIEKIILGIILIVSAVLLQWAAVPITMIAYVIVSLIFRPV